MATTPQGMTQGFLQSAGDLHTTAQNNVPFSANNGNPNTIYNQVPQQGGYLPPVSNAYDQWRINPATSYGVMPINFGNGTSIGQGPLFNFPPSNGGGTLPTLPPSTGGNLPPATAPTAGGTTHPSASGVGNLYPVGSGGWMLGGPTQIGTGGGTLNTSYTAPYGGAFGLFGVGANGMSTSTNSGSGFTGSGFNLSGLGGTILDWLLPGDAVQGGSINPTNLGLGMVDQVTGLPITWGLDQLANTNWAQTSNNPIARWLAGWDSGNDSAALQQWYADNGVKGDGSGWLSNPTDVTVGTDRTNLNNNQDAIASFVASMNTPARTPEEILRTEGVAGLVRAGYNPRQINAATGQGSGVNGGMGIGNAAAGAGGSRFADVLQGDAARAAFAQMALAQLMTPTYQRHNNQN